MTEPADEIVTLAEIAADGDPATLEAAWLEALADPLPASEFLDALGAVPDGLRGGSAVSLLLLLLEAYEQRTRHADILDVVRALHPYRQQKVDLREPLGRALEGLYGGEPWFGLFLELSGLDSDEGDMLDAVEQFDRLARLVPGNVVYHRSGWGEGLIDEHDLAEQGFHVAFRRDGQRRFMPFTTGLDVLTVLDDDDLRARLLVDMEGLRREAEESPELLIRSVARLHKNRAAVKEIKSWLSGTVIEERSWASWWRKAKVAAARDPFLAVENPSRPLFVLRQRALTPEEELAGALRRANSLADVLSVVRGPLALDASDGVVSLAAEELTRRLAEPERDHAARAEAALTLARISDQAADFASEVVEAAVEACSGFAPLAQALPDASLRREALAAFVQARPQLWSDTLIEELSQLPPQLLDTVCDRLVAEGRGAALANRFHIFLLAPSRHAAAVLRLAKRHADGQFEGMEGAPTLHEVVMGLMHLAETQAPLASRGDKAAKEIMRLLEGVLVARKRGLVAEFAKVGSRGELASALGVLARCRQMPDEITHGVRKPIVARFPDLAPKEETPFWEGNAILCTRDGIARRQDEFRVLLHEKIPANSEDIGRAAAYGDLSENYEWTAAIEQQRQLTEKAAAMEAELKLAHAIEDQVLEPGVVCPGTRITIEQDGVERALVILGPWDQGEDVISYRAPLASGLLGARAGDSVEVTLPSGPATVLVKTVEPAVG
ncbi:MAG: GreA/GreB family elongation factor [Planctomycetota bacterium]